ncbi:MAG: superoxide dismutase [Alphaproteobacteria bacterium]|nr:superoxide dismutase [Alphaproteobacteria bacterium]
MELPIRYLVQPLPFKPHRLDGFTDALLLSHYQNNYGGAVRRLNAIEQRLEALDWTKAPVFEINGLKREQLVAMNSAILHEIYFDGLGESGGGDPKGDLASALERDFGSIARWRAEFVATAKAQGDGSGWTILSWSPRLGRLVNAWAAEHTFGIADGAPVLALDMYEHAYHRDFGANVGANVDTVMKNLAWDRIGARHARALAAHPASAATANDTEVTVEELHARIAGSAKPVILDVCLKEDHERKSDALPGARWEDPTRVREWASALPKGTTVVTYCLYGFQISRNATSELRELGIDAKSLAGGIATWRASGYPTEPFSAAS